MACWTWTKCNFCNSLATFHVRVPSSFQSLPSILIPSKKHHFGSLGSAERKQSNPLKMKFAILGLLVVVATFSAGQQMEWKKVNEQYWMTYPDLPCSCLPILDDCKEINNGSVESHKKAAKCGRKRRNYVRSNCPQVCKKYCVIFSVVRAGLEFENYGIRNIACIAIVQ